jgi:hypothetical protein
MEERLAQRMSREIRGVLADFLDGLEERTSSREFELLLFGKDDLEDLAIGYKPEDYTRFNLVEPLLDVVELEYQLEPRADVRRKRWPDFEITSTGIPYIGEVEPMNSIERGEDEIKEYLGIDGFDSPYGILTDGIEWRVFGPSENGGHTSHPVERRSFSLADALRTVAATDGYWQTDALSSQVRSRGVEQMEGFPKAFYGDDFDVWALEKMPREFRREFLAENRSLQASLDGCWE